MIDDILNDHQKLIFSVIFIIMVVDIICTYFFYRSARKFILESREVKAKIIRIEKNKNNYLEATLKFDDSYGKPVEASVFLTSSKQKEGDEIEVLSHKEDPKKIKRNTFFGLWSIPVSVGSAVVTLVILMVIMVKFNLATVPF